MGKLGCHEAVKRTEKIQIPAGSRSATSHIKIFSPLIESSGRGRESFEVAPGQEAKKGLKVRLFPLCGIIDVSRTGLRQGFILLSFPEGRGDPALSLSCPVERAAYRGKRN